jgi:glycosyltransferase involved in cell wall biosynthesis
MKVIFSIIIPVYNREDCIARCLKSVLNQSFGFFEIIIINDGSIDNTLNIIKSFKQKNINLITYSENKGVNYARNRGIENVKGEYIIFLDSDDMLAKNALAIAQQKINVFSNYDHYLFGVSDRIKDESVPQDNCKFNYKDWLSGKISGDFAHVIKPTCFKDMPFYEEFRIYESLNWLRILKNNKEQLFIPNVIVDRDRDRDDSVTLESLLDNKIGIRNQYRYILQYIHMYYPDLIQFQLINQIENKLKKGILLGVSLNEIDKNRELLILLKNNNYKYFQLFTLLNKSIFSNIIYLLIIIKSKINQFSNK